MTGKQERSEPGLESPLVRLRGVGPALAEKLHKAGLARVEDLLFSLPLRFEDRTTVTPIGSLRLGARAQVLGEILLSETVLRGRRSLLCRVGDGTGQLTMRLFHFSNAQKERLRRGERVLLYGETRPGRLGLEMIHPEYRLLGPNEPVRLAKTLTPVYSITDGVTQNRMRALAAQALEVLEREAPPELLPKEVTERLALPELTEAITRLHRPPIGFDQATLDTGDDPSVRRLAFEEILAHRLSLRKIRDQNQEFSAPGFVRDGKLLEQFFASLPFRFTEAQTRVCDEIADDLTNTTPMQRLIQGDVGSGKTVVACAAVLQAIESGYQVAMMAPTEILAEQHRLSFTTWLEPLGLRVASLKSKLGARERRENLALIESGEAQLVVGTHALFQESVNFGKLGLIIIDEQHRFGVAQRLALAEKSQLEGSRAHQLVMTATPIPRTLAMTAYADLDTSVIDELPPGRTPVVTAVLPEERRDELIERVSSACKAGRQAYWVCPLIEESEFLDVEAAESRYESLCELLPDVSIGLIHGRMKTAEKETLMRRFKQGAIALLVATTVIEVGVDVPNASLMIIENAERLGLSQLHQLRGRVGRGAEESSCLLLYRSPLGRIARERLKVMRETNDGFVVAEKDLELRGPGEVLGTRQTGSIQFRIASLTRDRPLITEVVKASDLIRRGPPDEAERIIERWLGDARRFATV